MSTTATTPTTQTAVPKCFRLACGHMIANMLDVVVTLGIPDKLKGGVIKTSDELATACHAHPDRLYRVMRALTTEAIFVEHEGKRFSLGPEGEFFRSDHPMSAAPLTRWTGGAFHMRMWSHLLDSVKDGSISASKETGGMEPFQYLFSRPHDHKIFQDCMTSLSRAAVPAIITAYAEEWTKFNVICDVGGGHGLMLAEIVKAASPKAKGILYEVPEVVKEAPALLKQLGVENGRIDCVAGDMFQSVPRNVDLYVMKHIIHDHDDDRCRKILKNCAAGLNRDGKILIMDAVIPGPNEPSFSKLIDVEMFAFLTGRERTAGEFGALLTSAGLRMTRIIPCIGAHDQIIEVVIA
jgi:hypothetical protein